MPKDQDNPLGSLLNNWPALTALVVAAIGLAITQTRLASPRPIDTASKTTQLRGPNRTVPARLWQDPLSVIPMGVSQLKARENELDSLFDAIPGPLPENPPVLFILAYVDPLTTANASEDRRRERYAALSALNTAGYDPTSSEKLSWFALARGELKKSGQTKGKASWSLLEGLLKWLELKKGGQTQGKARDPGGAVGKEDILIPYEWFRPRVIGDPEDPDNPPTFPTENHQAKYQAICILWVNEDINQSVRLHSLPDLPAFMTERIGEWIKPPADNNGRAALAGPKPKPIPTFVIAGRITSGVLQELSKSSLDGQKRRFEEAAQKLNPGQDAAPRCELYLTQATVGLIRRKWDSTNPWIRARYVIGTDYDLAGVLVKELECRDIWPGKKDNDIAIISEWDTEYGQRMTPTFLRAASGRSGRIEEGANRYATRAELEKQHFFSFTYLRGLDGKVPDDKSQPAVDDKSTAGSSPRSGSQEDKPTAEKGEGNNQIDYLRRLVARMTAEGKTFRAIGLLGSDVYDKLLLLQALRPSFPEAVFFTTDLDVRLLQPGDLAYTHNLLIVSHYGLTLDPELQRDNPPFRSGYDTSSYLGYLLAAGFQPPPNKNRKHLYDEWKKWQTNDKGDQPDGKYRKPHVYEICRSGAYDLTINDLDIFHPQSPRSSPWLRKDGHLVLILCCLAVFFLLLLPISSTWRGFARFPFTVIRKSWAGARRRPSEPTEGRGWEAQELIRLGCWLALLLTVVLCAIIYYSHTDPDGEPMEWLEGVSAWPTELLRWAASLLSLFFIAEAFRKLQKRNHGIETDYQLKAAAAEDDPSRWRRLGRELWAPFEMWLHWLPGDPILQKEWDNFSRYSNGWRRLLRCLLIGALYLLLFKLLDWLFDHRIYQVRGGLAQWTDGLLRAFSGACQVGLLVFVVDCAVLCYRFVRYLSSGRKLVWPDGLLEAEAKNRGIELTSAGDAGEEGLRQLLTLELIDDVTRVVSGLIYKPFIILLILLVAQSSLFEGWHWNAPLILTVLVSAVTAFACAMILQRAADGARQDALKKLDELLGACVGSAKDDERARLTPLRASIDNMQTGAFASFYQNPAIRAALIPLGGGGGLAALEALVARLS
jgi:hypothetical protein